MSEEEQIERMRRNQERSTNRKKAPMPTLVQSSDTSEEVCHITNQYNLLNRPPTVKQYTLTDLSR